MPTLQEPAPAAAAEVAATVAPRRRRRPRTWLVATGSVLLALLLIVATDYLVLAQRMDHVRVGMPTGGVGTTWVIVGSDSRDSLPSGPNVYGSAGKDPGARADVVLVVHQFAGRTRAVSIPRDVLVHPVPDQVERVGLTFTAGPQALVDSLCNTLHIAASRLVIVTMRGVAAAIDAVGGITVSVPHPVRDRRAGLHLDGHGRLHLSGQQALALVRARHVQTLVGGRWRGESGPAGARHRAREAAQVYTAAIAAAAGQRWNPLTMQRVLWNVTSGLTTDDATSLLDLRELALAHVDAIRQLPASPVGTSLAMTTNAATERTLAWAGYGATSCRPPGS